MFEAGATPTYLDALNPEQLAAATHPGGPLLVLAGALAAFWTYVP